MRHRIVQYATLATCLLWTAAGFGMLALLLLDAVVPSPAEVLVIAGCAALALVLERFRYEFRHRDARLVASPDAGFLVLVALVADPAWAAIVGAVVGIGAARRVHARTEQAFRIATSILATGLASLLVHEAFDGLVDGRAVLGAVAVAALVRAGIGLLAQLLLAQAREPGTARTVLVDMPVLSILAIEAGLPIATVAMAGPFLNDPPAAMLVVLGGQLLTWRILAVQHAQYTGRRVTDDLLDTFQRYVPRHVAQAILDCGGGADAQVVGGEQRDLTVMFVDIHDFTSWSEHTDPPEVFAELNLLVGELANAILATDGTIDKFTGDGIMAFWNAPADQPDHALRAVQSLPRLLMRVREFNLRRDVRGSTPLEIGIGIATGPAMVGNIGHRDRLSFTAIGDTINRAARLEKATRDADLPALVDEATFLALPHGLQRQLSKLDSIAVKGRSERVRIYAPTVLVRHRDDGAA